MWLDALIIKNFVNKKGILLSGYILTKANIQFI